MPLTRFSELAKILERYSAAYRSDPAQVPQSPAGGFSGAVIWKIESPAGPCALRATRTSAVDRFRLAELHRLIVHVRTCGFMQMPVPLATSDGQTFFESDNFTWQLEPWMPGVADYSSHPNPARLAAAMTCLAHWHVAAARFVARESGRAWFFTAAALPSPGLAIRLDQMSNWHADACDQVRAQLRAFTWVEFATQGLEILDLYQKLAPRIAARLKLGMHSAVPLQPCLRDVWHDHVLFTGDEVTGLIDPHAARSDCVATDLARLLGSLVGDDHHAWDAGLAAYQLVRPLSFEELALVELFDQSTVLLAGMTWLEWCCLQGRSFADRERVVSRLKSIVSRMKHLATK
jgi:Ser/Thr protein kinase RdoA (MazF antagonist)